MNRNETAGLLQLFRGNISLDERLNAFSEATAIVKDDIQSQLSKRNVRRINQTFDLHLVLNAHGDYINAGQTIDALDDPFITFVESANGLDTEVNPVFKESVDSAFGMRFNNAPYSPQALFGAEPKSWHVARDRGLLKKGSLISHVDIRDYGLRLLDALMGQDYSQDFLNSRLSLESLANFPTEDLVRSTRERGLMVLRSNELREHVAINQMVKMLLDISGLVRGEETSFDETTGSKIKALFDKQTAKSGPKTEVGIIYGSAHHKIKHTIENYGLPVRRTFANSRQLGRFAFLGTNLDTFFSGYTKELSPEAIEDTTRSYILESVYWCVMNYPQVFEAIPETHGDSYNASWAIASKLARAEGKNPELLEQRLEDLRKNPIAIREALISAGAKLRRT